MKDLTQVDEDNVSATGSASKASTDEKASATDSESSSGNGASSSGSGDKLSDNKADASPAQDTTTVNL